MELFTTWNPYDAKKISQGKKVLLFKEHSNPLALLSLYGDTAQSGGTNSHKLMPVLKRLQPDAL